MSSSIVILLLLVLLFLVYPYGRRLIMAWRVQGPKNYPVFGVSFKFILHPRKCYEYIWEYFEKYPSGIFKVWFSKELVFGISKPEYLEKVLNSPHSQGKMDYIYKFTKDISGDGLISSAVPKWKVHRKIIAPSMNQTILNKYVATFAEQYGILVEHLTEFVGGKEWDVSEALYKANLDVTCETTIGVKVHAQTTKSQYHEAIEKLMDICGTRMTNLWYHFDFTFRWTKLCKEYEANLEYFWSLTNKVVENKIRETIINSKVRAKTSLMDLLVEELTFSKQDVMAEANTFIIGGVDTMTSANISILLMLGMHPDIQEKVFDEAMNVVGPATNDVNPTDLNKLKYTECVIKEALRLFPPTPYLLRTVAEDIHLKDEDGTVLPKGSHIIMGILPVHRSAKYWKDPLKFDPERFTADDHHPCAFIPFLRGPRNCLGAKFAMMAMKVMVVSVVRKFKISTSYKSVADIKFVMNIILTTEKGCNICLENRS